MKKYVLPLFMFLAALFLTVTAAASDVLGLHDGAKLLQTSERTAVMKELQDVEKRYGVGMAIITVPSTNKMKIGDYANKLLDSTFKDGKKGNMVLVLAMDTRDYYIATDKAMKERITDAKGIPALEEKFLPALKKSDYAGAFTAYARGVGEQLAYYEENGKAYDPKSGFSPLALVIALAIGGACGFLIRAGLIRGMSNVVPAPAANTYLDRESFELLDKEDTFLYMNVTRTPKAKKNDSTDAGHGGGGGKF